MTPKRLQISPDIRQRVFVVGCPRSGTTLLQSYLAAHDDMLSCPEVNFLNGVAGNEWRRVNGRRPPGSRWRDLREQLRECLGIANRTVISRLEYLLSHVPDDGLLAELQCRRRWPYTIRGAVRLLTAMLDSLTVTRGKHGWLEKSPAQFAYVRYIFRHVPGARVIHILRDGADVVASLQDAARKYPDQMWGPYRDLDLCIDTWNRAVQSIGRWNRHARHLVVHYEQLLERPDVVLPGVFEFVGLSYSRELIERRPDVVKDLNAGNEPWKDAVSAEVRKPRAKFDELFTPEQAAHIRSRLVAP